MTEGRGDDREAPALADDLTRAAAARPRPGSRWRGRVRVLAETESTNDDAKRAASGGAPEGETFVADRQRAGRGRQGRVWHAPGGVSLLASVVLRPRLAPASLPPLALAAGLAVIDAVEGRTGSHRATLKWPNDVLVAGRKLAGVLVEASVGTGEVAWAVVGVGVNVRAASLPTGVAELATSLESCGGRGGSLDRSSLLGALLGALETRVGALERGGLAALAVALRERDGTRGRQVVGEGVAGVAEGIDEDGRLVVRRADGTLARVAAGEVRFGPALSAGV